MKHIRSRLLSLLPVILMAIACFGCSGTPSLPDETAPRFAMEPEVVSLPKDYTVAQLCEESDLVVVGYVHSTKERFNEHFAGNGQHNRVYVKVEEVLKGEAEVGETLYVREHGYIADRLGVSTEITMWGAPLMLKGHRVLVFLQAYPDQSVWDTDKTVYDLTQNELGKFFADGNGLWYPAMSFSENYKSKTAYMALENMEPRTTDEIQAEMEPAA